MEPAEVSTPEPSSIVLFDGVCHLCNGSVNFIIERDPERRFRFAPIQSPIGQELLRRHDLPPDAIDTVVLIEGEKAYTRSTAALRIARRLGGLWPIAYAWIIVPRPIRDAVYKLVARNRYKWFGKKDACMMPTPEVRERFLQT
jgi:predicted DCC family thiol-disulfide oxidoreductase YuxK